MTEPPSSKADRLLIAYATIGLVTLFFQIYVRSYQCMGVTDCASSYFKAVIWSMIWPLSWFVYLIGLL